MSCWFSQSCLLKKILYAELIKVDDHQQKQLLIVKQILLVSLFGNVWRTVWRICILMLVW